LSSLLNKLQDHPHLILTFCSDTTLTRLGSCKG
jgi:hypothetical protein